ncbi:hypothetical protein EVAR_48314_1 [Eumeta japonica]|uniref:Uncharacterized protein n=1 Tax=Eumeta variegata TaxID=151549 RepID=A0A4C1WKB8_EUMVA|nr:hypothetical protein EVAR_48314_1 [Eumeta japonica]
MAAFYRECIGPMNCIQYIRGPWPNILHFCRALVIIETDSALPLSQDKLLIFVEARRPYIGRLFEVSPRVPRRKFSCARRLPTTAQSAPRDCFLRSRRADRRRIKDGRVPFLECTKKEISKTTYANKV